VLAELVRRGGRHQRALKVRFARQTATKSDVEERANFSLRTIIQKNVGLPG